MQEGLSSYFTGLTNMASSQSKKIGPSYIEVDCYNKDNFYDEFARIHNISKEKIVLEESNIKLNEILMEWLGDKELVDNLLYWIHLYIKEPIKTYISKEDKHLEEEISGYKNSMSPFYFTEEIYFVEFKDYYLCFMIGNNE